MNLDYFDLRSSTLEADTPIGCGVPFSKGTPYASSASTASPDWGSMDLLLVPSPTGFQCHPSGVSEQGYYLSSPDELSISLPSPPVPEVPECFLPPPPPPPSQPPLPPPPAPYSTKPKKRTRPKRVRIPMYVQHQSRDLPLQLQSSDELTHPNNRRDLRKILKPEVCQLCYKGFPLPRDLNRHLRTHRRKLDLPTKRYDCSYCKVTCGEMHNLQKHVRNIHPQEKRHYGLEVRGGPA